MDLGLVSFCAQELVGFSAQGSQGLVGFYTQGLLKFQSLFLNQGQGAFPLPFSAYISLHREF